MTITMAVVIVVSRSHRGHYLTFFSDLQGKIDDGTIEMDTGVFRWCNLSRNNHHLKVTSMSLSHLRMTARARLSIQLIIQDRWIYCYRRLQFHFKFSCSSYVTFCTFLAFIFFFPYHDNDIGAKNKICFIQVDLNLIDTEQCILFVEKETWRTI